jgi:hypothetical protein
MVLIPALQALEVLAVTVVLVGALLKKSIQRPTF